MSYRFKEVTNFKIGEKYWESSQYGNIHFEVISEPIVTTHSHGERVEFLATEVGNPANQIRYILSEGYEHYGPKFYDEPAYVSMKEWLGE